MGKGAERERLVAYLPADLARRAKEAARREGRSVSNWLRRLVEAKLDKRP